MKPPADTQAAPQLDNIQILLQRRADLARNKAKYALTETDAQLLGTHSTEVKFEDGQTIIEENQDITQLYRIRSGKIEVSRRGFQMHIAGRGWFVGDPILIYNTPAYTMKVTMKARGPVVLDQLNLAFVQQLFKVDTTLKAKFMRHVVSKYSVFFMNLISDLENPTVRGLRGENSSSDFGSATYLTSTISSESLSHEDSSSSISSDDSLSSGSGSTPTTPSGSSTPSSLSSTSSSSTIFNDATRPEVRQSTCQVRREARKRASRGDHVAYKTYPLANRGTGIQFILVKSKKLKVVSKSFGFSFKTSIEYSKIQSINKVGENALTVVYQPRKVANVFFKNYFDREEFFGIVNSLTQIPTSPTLAVASPETGRKQGPLTVPHNPNLEYDEVPLCGGKENACKSQQIRMSLKKGDHVVEEGDLFQRVYTLLSGSCDIVQKGKKVCHMDAGQVFGVPTLLYLRPCPVTLEVSSETAELVYIPAYKLSTMLETDTVQASDLYQHAAQALDRQISCAVGYLPACKRELRERSNSDASLRSESSTPSMRERSDSNASEEGALESAEFEISKQEVEA